MRATYHVRGASISQLSKLVGVDKSTAYKAVLGDTWKHVGVERPTPRTPRKLSDQTVVAAREIYAAGLVTQHELARMLGIYQNAVGLMLRGLSYKHVPMPKAEERIESTVEHLVNAIIKRLHMTESPDLQRAIALGFRAGHHLSQMSHFDHRTQEEVMGEGNSEYSGCRLDLSDIRRLHHAWGDDEQ